jgi:hypothetical protein
MPAILNQVGLKEIVMSLQRPLMAVCFLTLILAGCAGGPGGGLRRDSSDTFARRAAGRTGAASGADRMTADLLFLDAVAEEMHAVLLEASVLARQQARRDDVDQEDLERYAYLLFRFQLCRSLLWEIADFYAGSPSLLHGRQSRLKAQLVGMRAAMQIAGSDSQFLLLFHDDEVARAVLNRAYPQAEIEAGTYNAILETTLNPANLDARDAAWHFFQEAGRPGGEIARAEADDAQMRTLTEAIRRYHMFGEASIERLLGKRGVVFPAFENRVRKSMAAGALKAAGEAGLSGVKALGHFSLQLLRPLARSPFARHTEFSRAQHELMRTLIQPGDVLLTYTSGYLSSLFFPGVFKHGIVYVGDDLQRQTLRIRPHWRLAPGGDNLIEAVGQGVIWNDLGLVVGEKVSLVAVLRPVIDIEERRAYLQKVHDFLGRSYDLRFDFMCPKRLCCTEVVYHTLNGRGRIQFPMAQRFGMPTLSADDMLKYYLSNPGAAFNLVFLGAPDPAASGHEGVVLVGEEANARLRSLLAGEE